MKSANRSMPTPKREISIKTKLLFSYLILIFLPLLVLTALTYRKVSLQMEGNMLRTSQNALTQSAAYLETKLNTIVNDTNIIYFNKSLQNINTEDPDAYDADLIQQNLDEENLISLLNQLEGDTDIFRIRLYLRDISGYYYDNNQFYIFKDLDDVPWYEKLTASKSMVTWIAPQYFAHENNNGIKIISLARRVTIRNYNVADGVIRIDMRESVVNEIVKQANVTATGLSYIANSSGEMIASSGDPALMDERGDKYIKLSQDVANTDWKFISLIPYSEIKSTGHAIRLYMMIVLLITGGLSYLIAYFWFNSSALRLKHLARSIRKVTGGHLDTQVKVSSNDEIGQISRDFNFMVQEMAAMIEKQFESGKRIKSLELKSLQSQINPHLLYNSLDMINWSAMMNGNEEIRIMVQSLSKFYKIGLSKGDDTITVGKEIEHVTAYVTLQNLRFEHSIKLEVDVEKGIQHYEMLKITMQPIVENAILHGILKKPEKAGIIRITGTKTGGTLVFTISDDGVGMSDQAIARILEQNPYDEFHGYGIKNINERIKLQYGPAYGLAYRSSPGAGTVVTVTLPAIVKGP